MNFFLTRLGENGLPVDGGEIVQEEAGHRHKKETEVDLEEEKACGSCYGADPTPNVTKQGCCTTCQEVQDAYQEKGWSFENPQGIAQCVKEHYVEKLEKQKHEGCHVKGTMHVARVQGNFNIIPGKFLIKNARYVVDSKLFQHSAGIFNISHTVNHLSFGDLYPGMSNPLDGDSNIFTDPNVANMLEYMVKIVPTVYENSYGEQIRTNQFSALDYQQPVEKFGRMDRVPGFFVIYDLSPVTVVYKEYSKPFLHFLANLCAVIGGIYTIFNILDSIFYSGIETLKHKIAIGKDK